MKDYFNKSYIILIQLLLYNTFYFTLLSSLILSVLLVKGKLRVFYVHIMIYIKN